ncbi:extracellular catalytic domain type 1 short-chain-length polyhydroxyalkanoate depolymerase [Nevskia sp.]|uniref:extracellular catalytic domain type 1 short-chain-length polyhydroxyalkanoate depolymerase n=1 Tax=Nevskia sp. TaxID=1929292 RepID=UPI003F7192A4
MTIDPVSGFLNTSTPIAQQNTTSGFAPIRIAVGTTATSQTITVAGVSRRYVLLRPAAALSNPPLLVMLHPSFTSSETMANTTNVSDYALTQGFWVVLPQAQAGGWNDDQVSSRDDDVQFISQLIDTLVAQGSVDPQRIYATGFSSGGFMTQRLACSLPDKIAAFAVDAATMRNPMVATCASPSVQRPKLYFLGTADLIVAYNGVFPELPNGQRSADGTMAFWAGQQGCDGPVVSAQLPDRAADGTRVTRTVYGGCRGDTRLELFTINGGGHAWPGGEASLFGVTTRDIQATGLLWLFVRSYRR